VRKRTLENFSAPGSRETGLLADGVESAEDEQKTPKVRSTIEAEDMGSGSRYPTRKRKSNLWSQHPILHCARVLNRLLPHH
jgi:hypothetical protein